MYHVFFFSYFGTLKFIVFSNCMKINMYFFPKYNESYKSLPTQRVAVYLN